MSCPKPPSCRWRRTAPVSCGSVRRAASPASTATTFAVFSRTPATRRRCRTATCGCCCRPPTGCGSDRRRTVWCASMPRPRRFARGGRTRRAAKARGAVRSMRWPMWAASSGSAGTVGSIASIRARRFSRRSRWRNAERNPSFGRCLRIVRARYGRGHRPDFITAGPEARNSGRLHSVRSQPRRRCTASTKITSAGCGRVRSTPPTCSMQPGAAHARSPRRKPMLRRSHPDSSGRSPRSHRA